MLRRIVLPQCPRKVHPLTTRGLTTIGIRREDPARVWERRAPLTPAAIKSLLSGQEDLAVEVESCDRRCFPNELYRQVSPSSVVKSSEADLGL